MPRLLVTHPVGMRVLKFGSDAIAALQALGEVRLNPWDRPFTQDELIEASEGCQVIIADRLVPGDKELFATRKELVAFVRNAVDIRNIDLEAACQEGVLVTCASSHFIASVVELTVGIMVGLSRHFRLYAEAYGKGEMPVPVMGSQLQGKCAGIIGLGTIGRQLASALNVFGMHVLGCDPYAKDIPQGIKVVSKEELLGKADFVIILARHTPETNLMCDASFFENMRQSAFFINMARGPMVDEVALANALSNGTIAGAGLDVGNETDDIPSVALGELSNVLAMPHIGGLVVENIKGQANDSVNQARAVLQGRMPEHALNPNRAERFQLYQNLDRTN